MKLLIVGNGRAGSYLANYYAEKGHEVTVVDRDAGTFRSLRRDLNLRMVQGSGTDVDVLREAGIETADAVAAVTDNDDANIMTALIAKRLYGVSRVVTGLRTPRSERLYQDFELHTVCPFTLGAERIIEILSKAGG